MRDEDLKRMRKDMTDEMRANVIGSGYVPEYYEQLADGFVGIAEYYIDQVEKRYEAPRREERAKQLEEAAAKVRAGEIGVDDAV